MKKRIFLFIGIILCAIQMGAQPSSVKKVGKSIFTLTTYDKDGNVKSSSTCGVFISNDGQAVGLWSPFVGTHRATATTADGTVYEVATIMGANELYDVCKFKVEGKTSPATISTSPANNAEKVWLVANSDKKAVATQHSIEKVEAFMEKYSFYLLATDEQEHLAGQPFVNEKGQVVGLLQTPNATAGLHAVDARYASDMKTTGLSINSSMLRQTDIRLELPDEKEQALIMLMMSSEFKDSLQRSQYIDDFIQKFPTSVDGYSMRALDNVSVGDFEKADQDMKTATEKAEDKAEAHAEYSRVIYHKMLYSTDTTYVKWSLDKALEEINKAQSISPKPTYRHREAQIEFSKGNYQKAYDTFMALTKEPLNKQELFFEAAQCKLLLNAEDAEIVQILDSAVAACPQPLDNMSAPYVLARGNQYFKMAEYRKALADFNVYDTLMYGRADAEFYYTKYKCEVQVKQYQQALNDIAHAAYISPREPLYLAEMSSLQLRLNQIDNAIKTSELCINVDDTFPDAYIIKGVALINKNEKEEAMKAFEKAKELGDERGQTLIDKYK